MSTPEVTPSASAVNRRRKHEELREERVLAVSPELAKKIIDSMEPNFSEAYARGEANTFEEFVFKHHTRVFDLAWLSQKGITTLNVTWFPLLFASTCRLIEEQLRNRYNITAQVYIYGGGDWETSLDWYVCDIRRPVTKWVRLWRRLTWWL